MGREIYSRDETDPNFRKNILEVSDELECLLGQIRMMMTTRRGEVLGAPDFGASLDDYIFSLNANEYVIRTVLKDQTTKFIPLAERYFVDYAVKFFRGTSRDACLVDVIVNNVPTFGMRIG